MCWFGIKRKKIAKSDISVFKIVDGNSLRSYYRGFPYTLGGEYFQDLTVLGKDRSEFVSITKGFHSYDTHEVKLHITPKGVYAINNLENILGLFHNVAKLECIVPAGSTYYKNSCGEIVSDKLKVIGMEKLGQ